MCTAPLIASLRVLRVCSCAEHHTITSPQMQSCTGALPPQEALATTPGPTPRSSEPAFYLQPLHCELYIYPLISAYRWRWVGTRACSYE